MAPSKPKISLTGRVAVVTGANRGIGFEVCRQLSQRGAQVILTSRNADKGLEAVSTLKAEGLSVDFWALDVTVDHQTNELGKYLRKAYGKVDILINNAGVLPDNKIPGHFSDDSILNTDLSSFLLAFETNALSVIRMCKIITPLMKQNKFGRIVNVSSLSAQLTSMDSGIPAYRISKTAMNAITRILADELKGENILCNCISPGWVKTDMGGHKATVSVVKAANAIIRLACFPDQGPTGGFFRNGKRVEW